MKKYDVIIVGGGIGGLMTAKRLIEGENTPSVAIFEQGASLENRKCPIVEGKADKCIHCKSCAIMSGIAGAGAFSDGKFNITTEYGGWLQEYIGHDMALAYQYQVYDILKPLDDKHKVYAPNDALKTEAIKYDLHMLQGEVVHFGTDGNLRIMTKLVDILKEKVDIHTNAKVEAIDIQNKTIQVQGESYAYGKLVLAVGRVGSSWLAQFCQENGIELSNSQVDIGVRVELPRVIWEDISRQIYEPKIIYRTKTYGDRTRMFCFNSGGEVVMENSNGILTVNGHANSDEKLKTKNSNFAILSTQNFTEPFNQPIAYAKQIARLANMVSGGSVIVQRFGDLVEGKRTNAHRLSQSTTIPTLNATPGDLSLCMPKRQLDNIIETIYALDKIAPGTANRDTLLYGAECKYYSARPKFLNTEFEIAQDIYCIGDGASVTRSLSQAGAQGLYVADKILDK
ncbi:MAG: FAD-dependent oxidoreductase [Ruminococcaceae bacterium]|nr:FAD-dependent oxidoreductase [Oscillospiraceae bacterium]